MNQILKIIYGLATLVATTATLVASPKSVNVALETSLLFEPKDSHQHLTFLRSFRKILDQLERALEPQIRALRTSDDPNKGILTKFVRDVVKAISKFHDLDMGLFFTNLDKEMGNHFYKGAVFREMVYDPTLQTYIRNKLRDWASADPRTMRAKLRKYSRGDINKNTTLSRLWTFLNDYFDADNEVRMRDIVDRLKDPTSDLPGVIREALNYFIFEHYDKMNYTARAKFADEIHKLSDGIDSKSVDKDLRLTFRKFSDDTRTKEPIKSGKDKTQEVNAKDPKAQLVLNKDVEIYVKSFDAREESQDRDEDAINEQRNNISSDNNDFLNDIMNGV